MLKPYPLGIADSHANIDALSSALAEFGDADTADLFTGISRAIDQQIWLIESHLSPSAAKGGKK